MLTLGDVFAFAAILVGFSATVWGATVLTMLLAKSKTEAASSMIKAGPWKAGFMGLAMALVVIIFGIILINVPAPLIKVIGIGLLMVQALLGVLGAASVASLAAERIRRADSSVSEYGALVRASLLVVSLASMPFIGWFLVTPVLLAYGASSLFAKKHSASVAVSIPPVEAS